MLVSWPSALHYAYCNWPQYSPHIEADLPPLPILQVTAVAARQLEKAQEFAKEHNIEKAYGSYPELIADGDIGQ